MGLLTQMFKLTQRWSGNISIRPCCHFRNVAISKVNLTAQARVTCLNWDSTLLLQDQIFYNIIIKIWNQ